MKKKVFFGQGDIRFLYFRYKDSVYYSLSIFAVVIVSCLILIMNIIIPQVQKYLSIRNSVIDQRTKIQIISENINFINNLDKAALDSQLQTVTSALPPDQDISGILSAISESAFRSGITIGDYNFSLGSPEPGGVVPVDQSVQELKSIDLSLTVEGDPGRMRNFLTELKQKLPLSEVTSLDSKDNKTTIGLKFYYKLFADIKIKEDEPLTLLQIEKQRLIEQLASWKTTPMNNDVFIPQGTSSAVPLFE